MDSSSSCPSVFSSSPISRPTCPHLCSSHLSLRLADVTGGWLSLINETLIQLASSCHVCRVCAVLSPSLFIYCNPPSFLQLLSLSSGRCVSVHRCMEIDLRHEYITTSHPYPPNYHIPFLQDPSLSTYLKVRISCILIVMSIFLPPPLFFFSLTLDRWHPSNNNNNNPPPSPFTSFSHFEINICHQQIYRIIS